MNHWGGLSYLCLRCLNTTYCTKGYPISVSLVFTLSRLHLMHHLLSLSLSEPRSLQVTEQTCALRSWNPCEPLVKHASQASVLALVWTEHTADLRVAMMLDISQPWKLVLRAESLMVRRLSWLPLGTVVSFLADGLHTDWANIVHLKLWSFKFLFAATK